MSKKNPQRASKRFFEEGEDSKTASPVRGRAAAEEEGILVEYYLYYYVLVVVLLITTMSQS